MKHNNFQLNWSHNEYRVIESGRFLVKPKYTEVQDERFTRIRDPTILKWMWGFCVLLSE
jgi:hypothetical protein